MTEVIELLRKSLLSSPSLEAGLSDFLRAYKTWDKDGRGTKAQEFADKLDKVCHVERYDARSLYRASRFLTAHIFTSKGTSNV